MTEIIMENIEFLWMSLLLTTVLFYFFEEMLSIHNLNVAH